MKLKRIIATMTLALGLVVSGYAQHVITSSGTYTYADGDTISIQTTSPVTLYHCTVTCSANVIVSCIAGAKITIEDCTFRSNASTHGVIFWLIQPASVSIFNNHLEGGSGIGSSGIIVHGPTSGEIYIAENAVNNCNIAIQAYNVSNNPQVYINWNQVTGDSVTPRSDQISIFEDPSGAYLGHDFVECNPDAPNVPYGAGIQAGDQGTANVTVDTCTVLNGNYGGIVIYYGNNNTSEITNCLCLGIGGLNPPNYSIGIEMGHTGDTEAGFVLNTQCGWWNPNIPGETNFSPSDLHSINGNSAIRKSGITLAAEQAAYQAWLTAASNAGVAIGDRRGGNPSPTWPNASDFNF
jgi:hypothetical protein